MRRRWTLETARAILPDVRERTAEAVAEVEAFTEEREGLPAKSARRVELDQAITRAVSRWVRAMEALGVDVKGAWLVDFDTGKGCFCWRWPEQSLEYFHGYDEGFDGRARIQ
jgi:hypothetical protein